MTLAIGTISEGTLLSEDLASAILRSAAGPLLPMKLREELAAIAADEEREQEHDREIIDEAIEAMQELAPPYCRVGFHEGDGALLGVWPDFDALEQDVRDGEIVKIADLSELDAIAIEAPSFAMLVSDHGNVTLYRLKLSASEVWGVV